MSKSRYTDTLIIDKHHYGTWSLPNLNPLGYGNSNIFNDVRYKEHVFSRGERLDILADLYFGDASYWWVIALFNNIQWGFKSGGLIPGRVLRIPTDVNDVFEIIFRQ
jgi:hypothetical protein